MNILISNDHAGTELKKEIVEYIKAKGHSVKNYGDDSGESVDYPDFIHPLAKQVSENNEQTGIIICGSGNGVSMVANKYNGVRAAICWNEKTAELAATHNNANIICIPARFISKEDQTKILNAFFNSKFEGGRHELRVEKIDLNE